MDHGVNSCHRQLLLAASNHKGGKLGVNLNRTSGPSGGPYQKVRMRVMINIAKKRVCLWACVQLACDVLEVFYVMSKHLKEC